MEWQITNDGNYCDKDNMYIDMIEIRNSFTFVYRVHLVVRLFNYLFTYSLINSFTFSINLIIIRVTRLNVKDFSFLL
jgi:hypothetical protein